MINIGVENKESQVILWIQHNKLLKHYSLYKQNGGHGVCVGTLLLPEFSKGFHLSRAMVLDY
jgi:hypothetical protein